MNELMQSAFDRLDKMRDEWIADRTAKQHVWFAFWMGVGAGVGLAILTIFIGVF